MDERPFLAGGTGIAVFVLVAGIVSAATAPFVAFSVFVGIPVGAIVALVAVVLLLRRLETRDVAARRVAVGGAAFGYMILALAFLRYVVASTRPLITFTVLVSIGVAAGIVGVVGHLVWERRHEAALEA